jgi:glycosyltransferase involved in cell wall biosynthesis
LSEALNTLAGDPARRRALGQAGRQRVERHFSIDRMVHEYARSYMARSDVFGELEFGPVKDHPGGQ